MSNLPMGAGSDPYAPYNIKETTFRFNLDVKGQAWYEYYGNLSIDEAVDAIRSQIITSLKQIGDIDIKDIDLSIY